MAKDTRASIRKRTLAAARQHITAQGEVMHATSLLQDSFFRLFSIILGLERPDEFGSTIRFHDHALAIWHVVQSDKQQREMAISAISSVPSKLTLGPAIKRLKWAQKQAGDMALYRNLIAHSPIMFRATGMKGKRIEFTPSFGGHSTRPIHRRRLELVGGMSFWRTLRNDLWNLSEYVEAVNQQIERLETERLGAELAGVPKSWPDRPRLRSLTRLQKIDQTLRPAPRRPRRRTRRRRSRRLS